MAKVIVDFNGEIYPESQEPGWEPLAWLQRTWPPEIPDQEDDSGQLQNEIITHENIELTDCILFDSERVLNKLIIEQNCTDLVFHKVPYGNRFTIALAGISKMEELQLGKEHIIVIGTDSAYPEFDGEFTEKKLVPEIAIYEPTAEELDSTDERNIETNEGWGKTRFNWDLVKEDHDRIKFQSIMKLYKDLENSPYSNPFLTKVFGADAVKKCCEIPKCTHLAFLPICINAIKEEEQSISGRLVKFKHHLLVESLAMFPVDRDNKLILKDKNNKDLNYIFSSRGWPVKYPTYG